MKIFEEILSEPAENSIFRQNINPLRVGLTLFKLIDDIQIQFNYSPYTSQFMKNQIEHQLKLIIDVYKEPNEIIDMMENQDIDGHNCFFYMQKYSLYHILDSKIMDKFIYDKWRGRVEFNSTIMDYSQAYNLLNEQHKLYQSDKLIDQLYQNVFDFNKQEKTHEYKFHVWKKSMALRYGIEFGFILFMTLFFQLEIGKFNKYLHLAKHEIYVMAEHKAEFGKDDFYHHEMELLHAELKEACVAQVVIVGERKTGLFVPLRCTCGELVATEGMGGFTYTINQANARQTTAAPAGWAAAAMPTNCWISKKGGVC